MVRRSAWRRCGASTSSCAITWSKGLRAIPGVTCTMPEGAFYAYPNVSVISRTRRLEIGLRRGRQACCTKRMWRPFRAKDSARRIMFASRMRPRRPNSIAGWSGCGSSLQRCKRCEELRTALDADSDRIWVRQRPFRLRAVFLYSSASLHGRALSIADAACFRSAALGHAGSVAHLSESQIRARRSAKPGSRGDDCKVANGPLAGQTLAQLSKQYRRELVGEAARDPKRFPLC